VWNPENVATVERHIRFMQEAARAKGVQLPVLRARTEREIDTVDLFAIVKRISDAKAQFRSLAEPWGDTGTSTGRFDARGIGRACRCGARSYPAPYR
jgi:hypothetical protein